MNRKKGIQLISTNKTISAHLVGVVEEVNGDADWLRVVVGMTKQHGHHLHPGRGGLPRPLHHRPLQRPLTVYGVLAYLRPGSNKGTLQSSLFLLFTCYYILLLLYIDNFPTEGGDVCTY